MPMLRDREESRSVLPRFGEPRSPVDLAKEGAVPYGVVQGEDRGNGGAVQGKSRLGLGELQKGTVPPRPAGLVEGGGEELARVDCRVSHSRNLANEPKSLSALPRQVGVVEDLSLP